MDKLTVGHINFGVHQLENYFDAIRNRMADALLFEELYYKAEYENEKLREEIANLKKRKKI
jgi:hypothetical protein